MAWYCNLFVCFNVLSDPCGTGPQTSSRILSFPPIYCMLPAGYSIRILIISVYLLAWLVHHVHVCIIATSTFI